MSAGAGMPGRATMAGDTPAEGARLSLVCVDVPERQAAVKGVLLDLGYTVQLAASVADAIDRMRKSAYEVIVLDEEFQGSTAHDNAVLRAVHTMPMSIRRYVFVTLLGRRLASLDTLMAFARSVNLVVNVADLSQLKAILAGGIADNDRFYRVYRDVLREAGRR
jgi:CheY-like chemotaxis protein